jgi:UDP-3-O-[3-hydroxymyristoyl] glucosamine N-acyltransferase
MIAEDIADAVGIPLLGKSGIEIHGPQRLHEASAGALTWVKSFTPERKKLVSKLHDALIVISGEAEAEIQENWLANNAVMITDKPRLTFARLLARFFSHLELEVESGVSPHASIDDTAVIGSGVTIGPGCFVGPCAEIGEGSVLHPGAIVHSRTVVGRRCILNSNCVVGNRGYGFVRAEDGSLFHMPQTGLVVLEDDVEIGSGTVVDRPAMGQTLIRKGTKIDNLCHIAHGCRIGPHAAIIACAEIGADVDIGEGAWYGPNSSCLEQLTLGPRSYVGIGSVVTKNVPADTTVAGSPAIPIDDFKDRRRRLAKLLERDE